MDYHLYALLWVHNTVHALIDPFTEVTAMPVKYPKLTGTIWSTLACFLFFLVQQPPVGQGLLIHEVSRSHSTMHHSQ